MMISLICVPSRVKTSTRLESYICDNKYSAGLLYSGRQTLLLEFYLLFFLSSDYLIGKYQLMINIFYILVEISMNLNLLFESVTESESQTNF